MGTVAFQGDNDEMIAKNRYRDSKSVMLPSSFNGGRKVSGDLETREMVDDHLAWQPDHRDDIVRPSHISDDQVQVNIGMADLMAYLQVVANNSNNLPLTRRDNPELSKMMSELTSEEYAMKSAAFIPADVRVIGGTFLRYGRVWDLPTSREYNASDGAHEPGRSYGGACSNALLKVLYDAANDVDDAAQTLQASEWLFDDDEESLIKESNLPRNNTFASIDMNDHYNPSVISWATLLRKMKVEIKEVEYAQVPSITSTRKFDLNQPFSLVPESFDKNTGKKRSLLIGCNYNRTNGAQLKAAHDDIRSMKDYIVNVHGFSESDDMMTILIEDEEHKHPTFSNITEAFKALSEQSQPGDAVFIQFSGHGGRVLDASNDQDADSYDEVIAPSDYETTGLIRDTLIYKTLLAPMRYGVTVTVVFDCCDTGMMLELPYSWSTRADRPEETPKMIQNDDFSFVRFLKVVKTLYESSTFTQLGKTFRSALSTTSFGAYKARDEKHQDGTVNIFESQKQERSAIMCFLCNGDEEEIETVIGSVKSGAGCTEDGYSAAVDTKDTSNSVSWLERAIMDCTLGQGDEMTDDEDTYKLNESYDQYTVGDSIFDGIDDDDS